MLYPRIVGCTVRPAEHMRQERDDVPTIYTACLVSHLRRGFLFSKAQGATSVLMERGGDRRKGETSLRGLFPPDTEEQ